MKNKLLISFILFVVILSFFTCSFASSSISSFEFYTGETVDYTLSSSLSSRPYYLVISYSNTEAHYTLLNFVFCDEELVLKKGDNGNYTGYIKGHVNDWSNIEPSDYNFKVLSYTLYSSNLDSFLSEISTIDFDSISDENFSCIFGGTALSEGSIIYSNFDVYDVEDHLVFQAPQVNKVVIPAIQQVEEIPQAMGQMMRILIPVGLIVFSIGLVIYLTRLVISRVQ